MPEARSPATALSDSLPHIVARRGQRTVVKLGGAAMENPAALFAALRDLAFLHLFGQRLVVVHGGGKPIDRALDAAGLVPKKHHGRRITDEATLAVVVRVLKDEINPAIVNELLALGAPARGEHRALGGTPLNADLGRVGQVTRLDAASFANPNVIPVLPSLALDESGQWLNVNADDAATAVAIQLKADTLVYLTDTHGVLADVADAGSRIARIAAGDVPGMIASGVIAGGMVPKLEGCASAVASGVGRVLILDGRVKGALLDELIAQQCHGTEIRR